jgi:TonB family protein
MEHPRIPLQRSFAISLGIHVLIFGTALAFAHYSGSLFAGPGVITVDLVGEGGQGRPGTGHRRSEGKRAVHRSAPVPASTEARAERTPLPAAEPSESGSSSSASQPPDGPSATNEVAFGGAAGSPGVAGAGGGLSSDQWRLLQAAIEKAKTYPRFARERGIEGTVLVRFQVLPSGAVDHVEVAKSSGAGILDDASVETVYRAGPMPYVRGWIEVPLVYELLPAE